MAPKTGGGLLRVNSNAVLVVPPFECAWLQSTESIESGCCISFDVKGDNDVTIIFKSEAAGRRWQHFTHAEAAQQNGAAPAAEPQRTERNYTVILGSHRNTCIKVEKDGQLCDRADNVPGTKLSGTDFLQLWVSYSAGRICVGTGAPGSGPPCYSWLDPSPAAAIQHVGLSSWDHHLAYRNIQITPPQAAEAAALASEGGNSGPQLGDSMPSLQDGCAAALQRSFIAATVCTVLGVADVIRPTADVLRSAALAFLAEQLPAVLAADRAGLQALSFDCMLDLLSHGSLGCEEGAVFGAVAAWARSGSDDGGATDGTGDTGGSGAHANGAVAGRGDGDGSSGDSCSRSSDGGGGGGRGFALGDARPGPAVDQLLPLVRFPLMEAQELAGLEAHPLTQNSAVLGELLEEARKVHAAEAAQQQRHTPRAAAPGSQGPAAPLEVADTRHVRLRTSSAEAAAARRLQRRPVAGARELMFLSNGDANGVCHWLGRNCGASAWVNPHAAGRLTVRASSPACRSTDPKALVGLNFARINFAGPRLECAALATWWSLDLGAGRALACNYYTLRADASPNFPRSWTLQASNDGQQWVDLRRHAADTTLGLPGQFASWPVCGQAAARPYRHFRVLLTPGPAAAASNPHELALSHLELYGYFSDGKAEPAAAA